MLQLTLPLTKAIDPNVLHPNEDDEDEDADLVQPKDANEGEEYQNEHPDEEYGEALEEDLEQLIEHIIEQKLGDQNGNGNGDEENGNGNGDLKKAATPDTPSKAARNKIRAAAQTGLGPDMLNNSGFIRTSYIEDPTVRARAEDHNDARAAHLKARRNLIQTVTGEKEGDPHEAAQDYRRAKTRLENTGAYFRIANTA